MLHEKKKTKKITEKTGLTASLPYEVSLIDSILDKGLFCQDILSLLNLSNTYFWWSNFKSLDQLLI